MVLFIVAAFVVFCSILVIASAMYGMWQESRVTETEEPTTLQAVGKSSVRMDIPQKYPLLRTRHSKALR